MIVIWCFYTKIANCLLLNFNQLIYEPMCIHKYKNLWETLKACFGDQDRRSVHGLGPGSYHEGHLISLTFPQGIRLTFVFIRGGYTTQPLKYTGIAVLKPNASSTAGT